MNQGGKEQIAQAVSRFFSSYGPMQIDSVTGPAHHGAGHRQGRAVDVGIAEDAAGYQKVIDAIGSGDFQSIGTIPKWANALKDWAWQSYHVNVFPDAGTGPHIHLEVGPWEH